MKWLNTGVIAAALALSFATVWVEAQTPSNADKTLDSTEFAIQKNEGASKNAAQSFIIPAHYKKQLRDRVQAENNLFLEMDKVDLSNPKNLSTLVDKIRKDENLAPVKKWVDNQTQQGVSLKAIANSLKSNISVDIAALNKVHIPSAQDMAVLDSDPDPGWACLAPSTPWPCPYG